MASLASSDLELEDISPTLDLVTFDHVKGHYQPGNDIFVIYQLDKIFCPSSRDWVGLYSVNQKDANEYLTFEWAPKLARDDKFPGVRSVLFSANYLQLEPSDSQYYEFRYITKYQDVVGSSRRFLIYDHAASSSSSSDESLVCVERPLAGMGSLTLIDALPKLKIGSLDTFEVVKAHSNPDVPRSQSPATITDHVTLTSEFDQSDESIYRLLNKQPIIKEYESNEERALVPANTERALVPVDSMELSVVPVENLERSLVPYLPRDVMPIFSLPLDTSTQNIAFDEMASPGIASQSAHTTELEQQTQELIKKFAEVLSQRGPAPSTPLSDHSPLGGSTASTLNSEKNDASRMPLKCQKKCRECRKKQVELRVTKACLNSSRRDLSKAIRTISATQDTLSEKELVLEELSSQVKDLIHENGELHASHSRLSSKKSKLAKVTTENRRLHADMLKVIAKVDEVEGFVSGLQEQNQTLSGAVKMLGDDNYLLTGKNAELHEKMDSVKEDHAELEQHLDDIMYTLSQQGFKKMVHTNGNEVDLSNRKGTILQLKGWTVALKKRTKQHLATIARQEQELSSLRSQNQTLQTQLTEAEEKLSQYMTQLQSEKENHANLQQEVTSLTSELERSHDKENGLQGLLLRETREKAQLLRKHQDRERHLMEKILKLQIPVPPTRRHDKGQMTSSPTEITARSLQDKKSPTSVNKTNKAREDDQHTPPFPFATFPFPKPSDLDHDLDLDKMAAVPDTRMDGTCDLMEKKSSGPVFGEMFLCESKSSDCHLQFATGAHGGGARPKRPAKSSLRSKAKTIDKTTGEKTQNKKDSSLRSSPTLSWADQVDMESPSSSFNTMATVARGIIATTLQAAKEDVKSTVRDVARAVMGTDTVAKETPETSANQNTATKKATNQKKASFESTNHGPAKASQPQFKSKSKYKKPRKFVCTRVPGRAWPEDFHWQYTPRMFGPKPKK